MEDPQKPSEINTPEQAINLFKNISETSCLEDENNHNQDPLVDLEKSIDSLIRQDTKPQFLLYEHLLEDNTKFFRISPLNGIEFIARFDPSTVYELISKADQQVHPYVLEYYRFFCKVDFNKIRDEQWLSGDPVEFTKNLNFNTDSFIHEIKSFQVQRRVRKHYDTLPPRTVKLERYISALFERHSRMLAVRIDLSYKQGSCFNPALAPPQSHLDHTQSLYEAVPFAYSNGPYGLVRKNRIEILNFIRKKFGSNLLGYIWKLEYGLQKGYHYHFLLFFNAINLRSDITIGKMIGNHWDRNITRGTGTHFNCNANKDKYHFCGIGSVKWNSPEMRTGLNKIANYLKKPDHLVRHDLPRHQRIIGTAWLPKPTAHRRGRPRDAQCSSTESTSTQPPHQETNAQIKLSRTGSYSKEFKLRVVREALIDKIPSADLARKYQVNERNILRWIHNSSGLSSDQDG